MPLDRSRLLSPAELAALDRDEDLLIIDVGAPERHARLRLPGSVLVTPTELVSGAPPAPGRLPDLARLERLGERLGLRDETLVVAYDDEGGGWAGRFLWTLEVIGHQRWKYLDGGLHAWQAGGFPPGQDTPQRPTRPQALTLNLAPVAEAEDLLAASTQGQVQLWDTRSHGEYTGERILDARGGHVPGARHLDWLDLMDQALHLRKDVETVLASAGINLSQPIITYCHSHHRSGLAWLVGHLLGANIRAYHGAWAEWASQNHLPVRTGTAP